MADTMIQEREFVKMGNFIPKNSRKLKELSRHPLALGGPARSTSGKPQGPARASLGTRRSISLVRYADSDDLNHLGEKSRASGFTAELIGGALSS
jgi:hypothetical protein